MKALFAVPVLCLLVWCAHPAVAADQQLQQTDLQTRKLTLEVDKLALEVQGLQKALDKKTETPWTTLAGSILAILTFIWSVTQGLKSFSQKMDENRQERISALLQDLSHEKMANRIGAIRAMSRYADHAVPELLSATAKEDSILILSNLEETLCRAGTDGAAVLMAFNARSIEKRIQLGARIRALTIPKHQFMALFGLSPETFDFLRKAYKDMYEHGFSLESLRLGRLGKQADSIDAERRLLEEAIQHERRLADISKAVLARWLREGRTLNFHKHGLDLSETNLYRVRFPALTVANAVFQRALMRHCALSGASVTRSVFNHANLLNADLQNGTFKQSLFINTNMRLANGSNSDFSGCEFKAAVFSEGAFAGASFNGAFCRFAKFRHTDLRGSDFSGCLASKAEFQSANAENTVLEKADLNGTQLIETNVKQAKAAGASFRGADMRGADFRNADLSNADLRGALIAGTDFRGAKLDGAVLEDVRRKEEALFS